MAFRKKPGEFVWVDDEDREWWFEDTPADDSDWEISRNFYTLDEAGDPIEVEEEEWLEETQGVTPDVSKVGKKDTFNQEVLEFWVNEEEYLHREDGCPAKVTKDADGVETAYWFKNGTYFSTEIQPSILKSNGHFEYRDSAARHHRLTGPAFFYGTTYHWLRNGVTHRSDGPAVYKADGTPVAWYLNGVHLTEAEFKAQSSDHSLTMEEFDGNVSWRNADGNLHKVDGPAVRADDGTLSWYQEGLLHRTDGPAIIEADGSEHWYIRGKTHREDGPAITNIFEDHSKEELWYWEDELHRIGGPAYTEYAPDGSVVNQEWLENGKLHRTDGPALLKTNEDGTSEETYYVLGDQVDEEEFLSGCSRILIKEDDHSFIAYVKTNCPSVDGGVQFHRLNGPATVDENVQRWYKDGVLHREDGPAVLWVDGKQEYWIEGKALTMEEFKELEIQKLKQTVSKLKEKPAKPSDRLVVGQWMSSRTVSETSYEKAEWRFYKNGQHVWTIKASDAYDKVAWDEFASGEMTYGQYFCSNDYSARIIEMLKKFGVVGAAQEFAAVKKATVVEIKPKEEPAAKPVETPTTESKVESDGIGFGVLTGSALVAALLGGLVRGRKKKLKASTMAQEQAEQIELEVQDEHRS